MVINMQETARDMNMVVYQCEDSLDGIFTAIYNAYEDKNKPEDVCISLTDELMLFAEYVSVAEDSVKSQKVINTLRRKFGEEDYMDLCMALSAPNKEKAQAVYRTIADGLAGNCRPKHLFDNLANNDIHLAFSLARRASREYDHLRGFLRFEELEKGILYAEIGPQNNLLPFLMEHFADRFPMENFMIYDRGRQITGIHAAGSAPYEPFGRGLDEGVLDAEYGSSFGNGAALRNCEKKSLWFLLQCDRSPKEEFSLALSGKEMAYQELFRHFCRKITITERRNAQLQRNMLPLRFREYMTEFRV
ncbi:MAG: TIGR03915 family putative DNA repair protein [Bacteroidales bacterium]|nr:TIGR03915 family putative DNA repair protein [Lachnoclostridium sp.]MCM1385076.1 TIGR03915 family putative DNA repair protein [Lachnoclostridium sp.]MCM1466043.1 TIGR03915 family putative DNA repair protein [Bacteroidales bacterium]